PAGWASVTVPEAFEPAGATVFPLMTTGFASVAWNLSPDLLTFDPTGCCSLTVRTLPAGITMGFGFGGGTGVAGAAAGAGIGALLALGSEDAGGEEAVAAGFVSSAEVEFDLRLQALSSSSAERIKADAFCGFISPSRSMESVCAKDSFAYCQT